MLIDDFAKLVDRRQGDRRLSVAGKGHRENLEAFAAALAWRGRRRPTSEPTISSTAVALAAAESLGTGTVVRPGRPRRGRAASDAPVSVRSLRDLRALGPRPRCGRRTRRSKRSGFHSCCFARSATAAHRSAARRPRDGHPRVESPHASVPRGCGADPGRRAPASSAEARAHWRARTVERRSADRRRSGPSTTKWWQIDIRTEERLSDVKWVWEAARHRDLVVLARAAALEPKRSLADRARGHAARHGSTQCPPERGVNWYSSLELALRAIAWAQMLDLVGDRLTAEPPSRSRRSTGRQCPAHHARAAVHGEQHEEQPPARRRAGTGGPRAAVPRASAVGALAAGRRRAVPQAARRGTCGPMAR